MSEIVIDWQPANLADDELALRPLAATDFDETFLAASEPLIWEQHPTRDRYKKEVFQLYFDGALASKTAFVIIDKNTGSIIGSTRYYNINPAENSIAIGFTFLTKPYWGGIYNRSIKKLMLDYAFRFVDKVYFHIGATNARSQLATMKFGAVKVNEIDMGQPGKPELHYEYLIRKKDWESNTSASTP